MADLPEGIQLLLTAGSRDESFRECFLEDPLLAARRAGVSLTDSERSILRSVPPAQLAAMIEGLAVSNPQRRRFLHSAASVALTIFAGTALAACKRSSGELEPDEPAPVAPDPEPAIPRTRMEAALAEARKSNRSLMIVVRSEDAFEGCVAGMMSDAMEREWDAMILMSNMRPLTRQVATEAGFLVVDHVVEVEWGREGSRTEDAFANERGVTKLPTILFLDPQGREISRCVQPTKEKKLIQAIVVTGALADAGRGNRPLMIVFRPRPDHSPQIFAGAVSEPTYRKHERQEVAERLCERLSEGIRQSAESAGVLVFEYDVKTTRSFPLYVTEDEFAGSREVEDLPTVLFLAPDREELSRLVHPQTEEELIAAIEAAADAFADRNEAAEEDEDG